MRFDLVVHNALGKPLVVVEVRGGRHMPLTEAEEYRAMLSGQAQSIGAEFLMLLCQDRGYVWRIGADGSRPVVLDMRPVVRRYARDIPKTRRLEEMELEMIAEQWLFEISLGMTDRRRQPGKSLDEIGLLKAMRGARVLVESVS